MTKKPTAAEKRLQLAREHFMSLSPLDPRFADAFNKLVDALGSCPNTSSAFETKEITK